MSAEIHHAVAFSPAGFEALFEVEPIGTELLEEGAEAGAVVRVAEVADFVSDDVVDAG